jgi:hypothetical protein
MDGARTCWLILPPVLKNGDLFSFHYKPSGRCKLRCLLSWGAQVFEKSVGLLKTLIPRVPILSTLLISEAFCVRSYCKKRPRGICHAKVRAVQTLLPRNCCTTMSVIQFRRQKRQGRGNYAWRERNWGDISRKWSSSTLMPLYALVHSRSIAVIAHNSRLTLLRQ